MTVSRLLYLANAERTGKSLEVAIALGVDPAMLLASIVKTGPLGPDKMEVAGSLRGAPVELARALTVDLDIPARAEVIIEGRVLPGLRKNSFCGYVCRVLHASVRFHSYGRDQSVEHKTRWHSRRCEHR